MQDQNLVKNLIALKKRSLDIKFNLQETDYIPVENIGAGAYGVVCSAIHKRTKKKVAIKKIPNVFDVEITAKRTYREIKILKHFKHDNVISIEEILKPPGSMIEFKDIYVVLDLMESDLHRIIHSTQPLTQEHTRFFLYQILRGLKYIHSASVIHRDLKPSNLLVNENCDLKIGDFGMARGAVNSQDECMMSMTQYVATRWYRAPELIMSFVDYTTAVDVWSVGCIFAEMINRKTLFPGRNGILQLQLIISTLGTPSEEVMEQSRSDIVKGIIQSMGEKTAVPLETILPSASKKMIDLLSKMLILDPRKRITVDEALRHPFLSKYHDPDDEPTCAPFDFSFENKPMDMIQLRQFIFKEILDLGDDVRKSVILKPAPKLQPSTKPMSSSSGGGGGGSASNFMQQIQQLKKASESNKPSTNKSNATEIPKNIASMNLMDNVFRNVAIRTSDLIPSSSDVEMLSAKSIDRCRLDDAVEMLSAKLEENVLDDIYPVEKSDNVSSKEKPTTESSAAVISDDVTKEKTTTQEQQKRTVSECTKALIKASIMQSSQKKKELGGDQGKVRPITAAQRQREREEKRRKKIEKANERKKKQKSKENPQAKFLLTDEDRNLLERWKTMAAQKPATTTTTNTSQSNPSTTTNSTAITNPSVTSKPTTITNPVTNPSVTSNPATITNTSTITNPSMTSNPVTITNPLAIPNPSLTSNPATFMNPSLITNPSTLNVSNIPVIAPSHLPPAITKTKPDVIIIDDDSENIQFNIRSELRNENSLRAHTITNDQLPISVANNSEPVPPPIALDMPLSLSKAELPSVNALLPSESDLPLNENVTFGNVNADDSDILVSLPQDVLLGSNLNPTINESLLDNDCADSNDIVNNIVKDMKQQLKTQTIDEQQQPLLTITPKGNGEGYGVGLDLDDILSNLFNQQNKDNDSNSGQLDSAPLSASLLADWKEVTGNMDAKDLELLQQELGLGSPIILT
ncbi:uncharacterized protein LOC141898768 [Tubulanus polymorphus]|uniref:uncharacterized protein LOC141898768 n=1 Tax=Tubulanus polymorphus TaxID=672921 RepID=UPI003DA629B8